MVDLIYCELLKLKRSKLLLLSALGALATPAMMLVEMLQTHFQHPERLFTLADVYDDSLIYVMLLMNLMVCAVVAAYLFSREYGERTLKNILPVPVAKTSLLAGKFCVLLLWVLLLTIVTWAGTLAVSALYHVLFGLPGFGVGVALHWLGKLLTGGVLMFLVLSPFTYLAEKARGLVLPMIVAAVVVMGSAALCNQEFGALYPWTAAYFLVDGSLAATGYPLWLSLGVLGSVSAAGFAATLIAFCRADVK